MELASRFEALHFSQRPSYIINNGMYMIGQENNNNEIYISAGFIAD